MIMPNTSWATISSNNKNKFIQHILTRLVAYIVSLAVRLYATFYIYSVSFGLFLFLKDEKDERDERDESEVGYRCC